MWPSDIWTLFDSGYVNDIAWEVDAFPRPNYTSMAGASLDYVESDGYFRMRVGNNSSAYYHHAAISTATAVKVPKTATRINCQAWRSSTTGVYMYLSLIPSNASTCINTSNGGIASSALSISTTAKKTYSLTLTDAVKGTDNLYVCLTIRGQANSDKTLYIDKVWFD